MKTETQDSIVEKNKLIAEFDGYEWFPEDALNGIKGVLRKEGRTSLHLDFKKPFHPEYHSSWDWLMPVVEKINTIDKMRFSMNIDSDCVFDHMDDDLMRFDNEDFESKIAAVHEAVYQFIQWYNQNNKP